MTLKRHLGRVSNTGARVIVVFRKLPDDEDHCLVVESDVLPDMYHDNMLSIVNSKEAQSSVDLYHTLHTRMFGDGRNCLQSLHQKGLLKKVPISMVEMLPYTNRPVPLEIINAEIDKTTNANKVDKSVPAKKTKETAPKELVYSTMSEPESFSVEKVVADAMGDINPKLGKEARGKLLLAHSVICEHAASSLKEEAYQLLPHLKPGRRKGRPKISQEAAAATREARNQRRRARYAAEKAGANSA